MTLIVAGISAGTAWMVSDTLITGGDIPLRDRQYVTSVSAEPKQDPGSREFLVIDPAWRTEGSPHAEIDGVLMRLRHIGLGWVSFLLPRKEASALGKWLFDNSATKTEDLANSG
jgi:hypothetical protein